MKAEKHLETLLANSPNRISTSSNTHSRSLSQSGNERTQYGIQYQNRDGDENVAWGNAGSGSGTTVNGNGTGTGDNTPPTGVPLDHDLEERALGMAIEETWEESGRRWRPWAANGRATRIGEILLLVDSDTVVPEDCLRDAAREMKACPTVAIIQHESGMFFSIFLGELGLDGSTDVMQVAHHYFENGIAYFTRRINRCISMGMFLVYLNLQLIY